MTFGKKGVSKLSQDHFEKLSLYYLMAVEEMHALVETIDECLPTANANDAETMREWRTLLVNHHNKIVTLGKRLPPPDSELPALAKDADAMEAEVAAIAEALWGYDEARVGGLILAAGILHD